MKKVTYSVLVTLSLLASCSSSDDDKEVIGDGFAAAPVSGVVYGENFTAGGGKSQSVTLNGVESLYIYLTPGAINCNSIQLDPISITVPAATGTYTSGITVVFKNPANDDFEGATDKKIEILSISETSVKGRIKASGFHNDEQNINGTFEVPYCPL